MLRLKEELEFDQFLKFFICRRGSTTARMRMKINMRTTLTCLVKTLTPREELLSEICVSERTRLKYGAQNIWKTCHILFCFHCLFYVYCISCYLFYLKMLIQASCIYFHSTWGIWIQIQLTMIQRLVLWERTLIQMLARTLMSKYAQTVGCNYK